MAAASCNDPRHVEREARVERLAQQVAELAQREATREKESKRLAKENAALRARVEELESRLAKTSRNSSRPPSSDSPHKDRPSRSRPSGRKPGGQPGHEGTTRQLVPVEKVDDIVPHGVVACPGCGGTDLEQTDVVRHQVTEVPPVMARVTEHQVHKVRCRGCGTTAAGELPAHVARSQFGPRVHALVARLTGDFRLSHREVYRVMRDLFGVKLGVGSLTAIQRRVTQALEFPFREAQRALRENWAAYIDETVWRLNRRKAWLWLAHYGPLAVYHVDRFRSRAAIRRMLAGKFYGTRIVDRTAVHDDVKDLLRQLCAAHVLRDFEGFATGPAGRRAFGRRGKAVLMRLFRAWWKFTDGRTDRPRLQAACEKLRLRMVALLDDAQMTHAHPRVRRFAKHLRKQADCLFTFAAKDGIEPTSNAAERMLRPAVLWRKGSFGSHSVAGGRFVSRILTTMRSLRLQGRDAMVFIVEALDAHVHGRAPPSLVPAAVAAP